jgi:predicted ribosomally synthesized peptide with nif11-like leader
MEQIKAFMEQAKADTELMAKLDALGAKGASGVEEVIALAQTYGYTLTAQDLEAAKAGPQKTGELSEADLDAVAGGNEHVNPNPTQNRYDPNECFKSGRTRYECVGFLGYIHCDHYWCEQTASDTFHYTCAKRCFDYRGNSYGDPISKEHQKWNG